jgi:hypothetical protein
MGIASVGPRVTVLNGTSSRAISQVGPKSPDPSAPERPDLLSRSTFRRPAPLKGPATGDLRNATYRRFVELGRAPVPHEVAGTAGMSQAILERVALIGSFWSLG